MREIAISFYKMLTLKLLPFAISSKRASERKSEFHIVVKVWFWLDWNDKRGQKDFIILGVSLSSSYTIIRLYTERIYKSIDRERDNGF